MNVFTRKVGLPVLVLLCVGAAPKDPAPSLVGKSLSHNFGSVVQGTKVRHSFTIYNKGDKPLHITSVTNDCPCFRAASFNKVIGIDGEGQVAVEIDTTGREGPLYLTPRIVSDDPRSPKTSLRITGYIEGPVEMSPKSFALSTYKGEGKTAELVIKNNRTTPLKVLSVESTDSAFRPRLVTEASGQKYRIVVAASGNTTLGRHKGVIKVKTNAPERGQLQADVSLLVLPTVVAKPEVLNLPPMSEDEARAGSGKKQWSVELNDLKGRPFKILSIKSPAPYVSVSATPKGKAYELVVALRPNSTLKAGVHPVDVDIVTNLPSAPIVRLPVRINVLAPG